MRKFLLGAMALEPANLSEARSYFPPPASRQPLRPAVGLPPRRIRLKEAAAYRGGEKITYEAPGCQGQHTPCTKKSSSRQRGGPREELRSDLGSTCQVRGQSALPHTPLEVLSPSAARTILRTRAVVEATGRSWSWVQAFPLQLQGGGRLRRPLPAQDLSNVFIANACSLLSMEETARPIVWARGPRPSGGGACARGGRLAAVDPVQ